MHHPLAPRGALRNLAEPLNLASTDSDDGKLLKIMRVIWRGDISYGNLQERRHWGHIRETTHVKSVICCTLILYVNLTLVYRVH